MTCDCFPKDHVLYEDELCMAVFVKDAFATGHLVVFPKEHIAIIETMPDPLLAHCFIKANELGMRIHKRFNFHGTNLLINNGFPGQEKAHFSINLLPRIERDGIAIEWTPGESTQEELKDAALFISDAMGKIASRKETAPEAPTQRPESSPATVTEELEKLRRIP